MKKILIALALGLAALTATADATWIPIVEGVEGTKFEGRKGSLRFESNNAGHTVAVIDGRIRKNGNIQFVMWSVPKADCTNGRGYVYSHNMEGDVTNEHYFVYGGGSITSDLGQAICTVVNTSDNPAYKRDNKHSGTNRI